MKQIAALLLMLLSLPLLAQARPPAPKSTAKPLRIRIYLQSIEVPSKSVHAVISGVNHGTLLYETLLDGVSNEVVDLSADTFNNTPCQARYNHVLVYTMQEAGKPVRGITFAPMVLDVTPHINSNHTITADLKIEITQVAQRDSDAIPTITTRRIITKRTFKGETLLVGDLAPLPAPGEKKDASADAKHLLLFVTLSTP